MKSLFLRWLINTGAIVLASYLIKGIHIDNVWAAVIAAALLGIINAFLRPILILLTLPINILTLGLLTFVINGFLFYAVSWAVKGFEITSFWAAFFGALIISIINWLCSGLFHERPRRPTGRGPIDVDYKVR